MSLNSFARDLCSSAAWCTQQIRMCIVFISIFVQVTEKKVHVGPTSKVDSYLNLVSNIALTHLASD